MKEVTYEDWQKNPTPRKMWVWHDDFEEREKQKVVYVIKDDFVACPVLAVSEEETSFCLWCHCAEIVKQRMTNQELSRWLRVKPTRECKYSEAGDDDLVYSTHTYLESDANKEVNARVHIREDDGEWREPVIEVEE